jgi:hypothetical protein
LGAIALSVGAEYGEPETSVTDPSAFTAYPVINVSPAAYTNEE